jgi:hypothetical protein
MATNQHTKTHWQTTTGDLTRGEARKIACYWDAFLQHTAPPGIRFRWSEWSMPEHLKHWCREHGLIDQAGALQWETTRKLWTHLIERAGPGEEIGADAVGQEQLPIDDGGAASAGVTRMLADRGPKGSRSAPHEQATLTGGEASGIVKASDEIEVNWLKGESSPSKHAKAVADDEQATLSESAEQHGDWIAGPARRGTTLSRASHGSVYAGQRPLIIGSA